MFYKEVRNKIHSILPSKISDRLSKKRIRKFIRGGMIPYSAGYTDYKQREICNALGALHTDKMNPSNLPLQFGYRVDERVVEYLWAFSKIDLGKPETVLDAGSTLNYDYLLSHEILRYKKLYLMTLDYEGFSNHNHPSYIYGDIRATCFRNDFFDVIICISTLEHVGMDNTRHYTSHVEKNENNVKDFNIAARELLRILRPGGKLLITLPFGKYVNLGWQQIFDADRMARLAESCNGSKIIIEYFTYSQNQWSYAEAHQCLDSGYYDVHSDNDQPPDYLAAARSIACMEVIK